jgi:hypothetical protein
VRDGDDLYARSDLVDGEAEAHVADVGANRLAGLKWEPRAEMTSATARVARNRCQPQGLANVAPDVSLGAFYDG